MIPGYIKIFGSVLLSHSVSQAVPSAQKSLTSVFGMGTGVASSLSPPKNFDKFIDLPIKLWAHKDVQYGLEKIWLSLTTY